MPNLTDQQSKAVASIDKNVLVSAGAGSGKTMVLVERYLEVLRTHQESSIFDVIAVTFTRKAADEMRSRLKQRLKQLSEEAQGIQKHRWSKLLSEVDRARIGTIHSLCESILKSFPAETGIDPQFELLDDLERAQLINDGIERCLQALLLEPNEDQLALLNYPIETIRTWALQQLYNIPQYQQARAHIGPQFERLEPHANAIITRVQTLGLDGLINSAELSAAIKFLSDTPFADPKSILGQRRAEVLSLSSQLLNYTKSATCTKQTATDNQCRCAACTNNVISTLAQLPNLGTAGGPAGKPLRDSISTIRKCAREFVDHFPGSLNEADSIAFPILRALLHLIDGSITDYERAKRLAQKVDYDDLIMLTHKLVCSENSAAKKHFGSQLKAILVDEFQDTNPIQAQLLAALGGADSRFFLIGDDKQSIYKFQGADVSTFNEWKSLISSGFHEMAGNGLLLELSYSFRSHPSIVNFINQFFKAHFASGNVHEPPHLARHQALNPSRQDATDAGRVELISYDAIMETEKRDSEKARSMEARAIAAWIWDKIAGQTIFDKHQEQERPLSFGDFAILVPTNNDFGAIESALANASIPYVTFAGSGFLNRQEIYDIENLLRWLKCPDDSHALLAVLRSPFFGINDGVIHKIHTEFDGQLWTAIQRASKNSNWEILVKPVRLLRQLQEDAHRLPLGELIRAMLTLTGYDLVVLALPNGKQKSRNAWKMAQFAGDHAQLTISEFLSMLTAMRALGAGKQTDAPLNSVNAVKLMTIHKSKGLEFPAVILPVLAKKINQGGTKLLVHKDFGMAVDTSRSKENLRPAFYQACATLNADFEEAERKRLFYVAMTRARDFLGVFFERYARNEQSFRLWIKSTLGIDCEPHSGQRAALTENNDFKIIQLDEANLESWESATSSVRAQHARSDDALEIADQATFGLLEPLQKEQSNELPPISPMATARVTGNVGDIAVEARILGTFFHLVMQYIAVQASMPDRQLLKSIAASRQINVPPGTQREFLIKQTEQLLAKFHQSDLSTILKTARRIMPEISYFVAAADGWQNKRPDLIFQDIDSNWHIVDFKTDKLASWQIAEKVNEHSSQVSEYVKDLNRICNIKALGWLYFAELGCLAQVKSPGFTVASSGQLQLPFTSLAT